MSYEIIVPENQPQGWKLGIEEQCPPCRPTDFCQPLLFVDSRTDWGEVFDAFVARAEAAGAVADISDGCLELGRIEFQSIMPDDTVFTSEVISAQLRLVGDTPENCNVLFIIQNEGIEPDVTPDVTVTQLDEVITIEAATELGSVVYGSITSVIAAGCNYTMNAVFTPGESPVEGDITITLGGAAIGTVPTGTAGSYVFQGVSGNDGTLAFTWDTMAGELVINSLTTECTLAPTGVIPSGESEAIGVVTTIQNDVTISGDERILSLRYQIVLEPSELAALTCGTLQIAQSCCCASVVYSECIKPISDSCGTISFRWSGDGEQMGFLYENGFSQAIRLDAEIRFPKWADPDRVDYIDSRGTKSLIYSEKRKQAELAYRAPEYVHSALAIAWSHDVVSVTVAESPAKFYSIVDGEEYTPNWQRESAEANIIYEIEEKTQNLKFRT